MRSERFSWRMLLVLLTLISRIVLAEEIPSLARVFEGQFRFGFGGTHDRIIREALVKGEAPIADLVASHSNIIGLNCFCPSDIRSRWAGWNWEWCDRLVAYANQHPEWPRRAHVLFIPFQKNPRKNLEWLLLDDRKQPVSKEEAVRRLRNHIQTVMGRYKGVFQYWDVVNEAVDPLQPDGLGCGLWKDIVGEELIELAFRFAREADPQAKLFYNDYKEWQPAKRDRIIRLVKSLKDKGLIDGIGLQQHVTLTEPTPRLLDEALARYAELGLEIHITELDMEVNRDGRLASFAPALAEAQARRFRELFAVYRKYPGRITAVMTWNVTDPTSWLRNRGYPHLTWPLLFDDDGRPKPAFWAIVQP